MHIEDLPPYKVYREHTPDATLASGSVQQGMVIEDQSIDGPYTISEEGDTSGWLPWGQLTRVLGTWAQLILCKAINDQGGVLPVKSQNLDTDASFAQKTVVEIATVNNPARCRTIGDALPETGDFGLVVQTVKQKTHEQIFIPVGLAGRRPAYGRIAWNCGNETQDFSEAELLQYTQSETFAPTGTIVWIDTYRSLGVSFATGGNDAIFELRFWKKDVIRNSVIRDLYVVERILDDRGSKITHFESILKFPDFSAIRGYVLSTDLFAPVWLSQNSRILTTIDGEEKENVLPAFLNTLTWDLLGAEDYKFLELSDLGQNIFYHFRPISPILNENIQATPIYRSKEEYAGNVSIASYRRYP